MSPSADEKRSQLQASPDPTNRGAAIVDGSTEISSRNTPIYCYAYYRYCREKARPFLSIQESERIESFRASRHLGAFPSGTETAEAPTIPNDSLGERSVSYMKESDMPECGAKSGPSAKGLDPWPAVDRPFDCGSGSRPAVDLPNAENDTEA